MASRGNWFVSRSVALSLAALLVLSGAMFVVTTLQQDSEEWVLVEDQVLDEGGIYSNGNYIVNDHDLSEYTFAFDEETSVYTYELTGGNRFSANKTSVFTFVPMDSFDYSKNYKIVFSSEVVPVAFEYYSVSDSVVDIETQFKLKTIEAVDGVYSGSIILLDQLVTDLSFKSGFEIYTLDDSASSTFGANTFTVQVYELQSDNTGSIAAGVTGLLLIVMGVFAMPMHNILRRK